MPRVTAPRPDDPPEWAAAAVRFSFGAVFGLVIGAGAFLLIDWSRWYWSVGVMLVVAGVCGYLAAKYGDRFWEGVRDWWV